MGQECISGEISSKGQMTNDTIYNGWSQSVFGTALRGSGSCTVGVL